MTTKIHNKHQEPQHKWHSNISAQQQWQQQQQKKNKNEHQRSTCQAQCTCHRYRSHRLSQYPRWQQQQRCDLQRPLRRLTSFVAHKVNAHTVKVATAGRHYCHHWQHTPLLYCIVVVVIGDHCDRIRRGRTRIWRNLLPRCEHILSIGTPAALRKCIINSRAPLLLLPVEQKAKILLQILLAWGNVKSNGWLVFRFDYQRTFSELKCTT